MTCLGSSDCCLTFANCTCIIKKNIFPIELCQFNLLLKRVKNICNLINLINRKWKREGLMRRGGIFRQPTERPRNALFYYSDISKFRAIILASFKIFLVPH